MNKKGFTLTEILVVIVITAILVTLIVPRALRAIAQANFLADQSNAGSVEEASLLCWSEARNWTACDTESELVPDFINPWPKHPCNGSYTLTPTTDPDGLVVTNTGACPDPKTFGSSSTSTP